MQNNGANTFSKHHITTFWLLVKQIFISLLHVYFNFQYDSLLVLPRIIALNRTGLKYSVVSLMPSALLVIY